MPFAGAVAQLRRRRENDSARRLDAPDTDLLRGGP